MAAVVAAVDGSLWFRDLWPPHPRERLLVLGIIHMAVLYTLQCEHMGLQTGA